MEVPFDTKKVTYPTIVCDVVPKKSETHQNRLMVGGNLLDYAGTLTTPTATITTTKCLFNSVVSTPNDKCTMTDIKNFYLKNLLPYPEYMNINISIIPQENIDEYSLLEIVNDKGFVYIKTVKGMYGLKQAGIIAYQELIKHLEPYGYHPVKYTPRLWKHETKDTLFSLVVYDFDIKYTSLDNAQQRLNALKKHHL